MEGFWSSQIGTKRRTRHDRRTTDIDTRAGHPRKRRNPVQPYVRESLAWLVGMVIVVAPLRVWRYRRAVWMSPPVSAHPMDIKHPRPGVQL
jgi:hypothetical protein